MSLKKRMNTSVFFFFSLQHPPLHHFNLPFCRLSFGLNPINPPPPPSPLSMSATPSPSLFPSLLLLSNFVPIFFPSTGTTSRRCSLDRRGMAFWEPPSYARCITNEFRYLQQSVGAKSAPSNCLCFQCIINYLSSVFPIPLNPMTL